MANNKIRRASDAEGMAGGAGDDKPQLLQHLSCAKRLLITVEHFRGTIGMIFINIINAVVYIGPAHQSRSSDYAMSKGTCPLSFWFAVR
jgi:hypothetical protein